MASHLSAGRGHRRWLSIVIAMLAALGGLAFSEYSLILLSTAFLYAALAVSLDLAWGYTGIPDLGRAIWFGIGALSVAIAVTELSPDGIVLHVRDSPWKYLGGLLLGCAVAVVLAAVTGWYAFVRGASHFYIAVVGIAMVSVSQLLYTQFPSITGGESGIFGFAAPYLSNRHWYFVTAIFLCAVILGGLRIARSDFGLLMRAVRTNERRARFLGFNVERIKVGVYASSAAISALCGGLYAAMSGLVAAPMFGFMFTTEILVWVALGGRGSIVGPAFGALAIYVIGARLSASFPSEWGLLLGFLFVLVVVFLPSGLFSLRALLVRRNKAPISAANSSSVRQLTRDAKPAGLPSQPDEPLIRIRDLKFGYGRLKVLTGLDLEIIPGELVCVVGPNGAGKSTLIGVLTDGELPWSGAITYQLERPIKATRPAPHTIARAGVVRKFQLPMFFQGLSVIEHLLLASLKGKSPSIWRRAEQVSVPRDVLEILENTGLQGREHEMAEDLPHGLKQCLDVAMAVAARPQVIFMDEPTAGLSAGERHTLGRIFRALADSGIAVVLIEHDLDFVESISDRVVVLHEGRILQTGDAATVLKSNIVQHAYLGSFELEEIAA